jgi:PRTRC genetic system protein A
MFKIFINDGTTPLPEDDIFYIISKEGIFLKKKIGVMESIAPVKNISTLQSIESTAQMNIKKIPGGMFARVIAFFREVQKKYYGEAIVLLFYDELRKVYKIIPPHQKVTAAACDYNKGMTIHGMTMIGTIHSHATMSAFHSGVDDHDEEHFDGLHITIGNVNQEDVSITASIVVNGNRFVVEPEEYVNKLVKTKDIDEVESKPTTKTYIWKNGKLVEDTKKSTYYSYRKFDKRYAVEVSERYHKVIPAWMEMVERGTYTSIYGYEYGHGLGDDFDGMFPYVYQRGGSRKWGSGFNRNIWKQTGRLPVSTEAQKNSPLNVGVNVKPLTFPKHEVVIPDDEYAPCFTCAFRKYKFLIEDEGLDDEPEVYTCKKCNVFVIDEKCPVCGLDDYLLAVDESELPENFEPEKKTDQTPIKTGGIKPNSTFVQCPVCNNHFNRFDDDETCPFCYAKLSEFETQIDAIESQMRLDSGTYISEETDDIRTAALEEAEKADSEVERIPDPAEKSVPITRKMGGFYDYFFGRSKKK